MVGGYISVVWEHGGTPLNQFTFQIFPFSIMVVLHTTFIVRLPKQSKDMDNNPPPSLPLHPPPFPYSFILEISLAEGTDIDRYRLYVRESKCSVQLACNGLLFARLQYSAVGPDTVLLGSRCLDLEQHRLLAGVSQDQVGRDDITEWSCVITGTSPLSLDSKHTHIIWPVFTRRGRGRNKTTAHNITVCNDVILL